MRLFPTFLALLYMGLIISPLSGLSGETPAPKAKGGQTWVNVRTFGARGNGRTDDTLAIQRAIATAYAQGGGVVFFPPGIYLVTSVNIKAGLTYQGQNAIIKRPAHQTKEVRTFSTYKKPYAGEQDSPRGDPEHPLTCLGLGLRA